MTITLVVAAGRNGVIGRDGGLPWHLPEDLAHFKRVTMGGTMIMGRKTYEAIGRPLAGRRSVVVTRHRDWAPEGVTVVHSLDDALAACAGEPEVFVVGGGEIFRQVLGRADRVELTEVDQVPEGDVTFPPLDPAHWRETSRDERDGMAFVRYERVDGGGSPTPTGTGGSGD
ncbi:MAG: dihydrofolate reductase [Actinomycetes bacterium]